MLELRIEAGYYCDTDRDLVRSIGISTMFESVLAGRDNPLGDLLQSQSTDAILSSSKSTQCVVAIENITARILLVPKAIRLLREYTQSPDSNTSNQLTEVLTAIADLPETLLIMSLIRFSSYMDFDPKASTSVPQYPLSYAFGFHSVEGLQLAVHFYTYKALQTSISLRCMELGIVLPPQVSVSYPDTSALQREGIAAAENLIRCCPYTLSLDTTLPLGALRMLKSMICSWAWWDSQLDHTQNCSSTSSLDAVSATGSLASSTTSSRSSSPDGSYGFNLSCATPEPDMFLTWQPVRDSWDSGRSCSPSVNEYEGSSGLPSSYSATSHAVKMRRYCEELSNYGIAQWGGNSLTQKNFARIRRIFMGMEEPRRHGPNPSGDRRSPTEDVPVVYPRGYTPRVCFSDDMQYSTRTGSSVVAAG